MSLQYRIIQKKLDLRQRSWLELLKAYDMSILYQPSKANIVSDALRKLSMFRTTYFNKGKKELANEVHLHAGLGVRLIDFIEEGVGDEYV